MSESAPSKFDMFYAKYPRKEARKDALKAWTQIDGDEHYDAIMAALDWQAPLWRKREVQHRPLPATYLRGERWTDERPDAVEVVITPTNREREQYQFWVRSVGYGMKTPWTLDEFVRRQREKAS